MRAHGARDQDATTGRGTDEIGWTSFTLAVPRWPLLARLRGRHALVRAVDRVEAAVLVLVFFASLSALPVAGAVGTAAYDALSHHHTGSAAAQAATGGVLIWAGTTVAAVALFLVTRALCDRVRQTRWDKGLHDLSEERS